MMRRTLFGGLAVSAFIATALAVGSACTTTVLDFDNDGGVGGNGGSSAGPASTPQICGQYECPAGQVCCYATSICFDPDAGAQACGNADGGTAPVLGSTLPGDEGFRCWSDLDCNPGQVCTGTACAGPGYCESPENGTTCGYSSPPTTVCGCDGRDYPSRQAACGTGIRIAGERRCGTAAHQSQDPTKTVCALDSNCPDGYRCCGFTGRCFDGDAGSCEGPDGAPGSPCTSDRDCQSNFCYQASCDGPKFCTRDQNPGCGPGGPPVCDCKGDTFRNRDCALYHGRTIAHDGPCN